MELPRGGVGEQGLETIQLQRPGGDDDHRVSICIPRDGAARRHEMHRAPLFPDAVHEGVVPAPEDLLREFARFDEHRIAEARRALELSGDLVADGHFQPVRGARGEIEVVDRHRFAAAAAVGGNRGRAPERRFGDSRSLDSQLRCLAVDDQTDFRAAIYGVTRLRMYLAIMSNSRFTPSPIRAVPRFVRWRVSGMSAAAKLCPSGSSIVSETPSPAIDPLDTTGSACSRGNVDREITTSTSTGIDVSVP